MSPQRLRPAKRAAVSTLSAVAALALALAGCGTTESGLPSGSSPAGFTGASPNPSALPKTNLSVLATGLRSPSALAITPAGTALIAAGNQLLRYRADEPLTEITHDLPASQTSGIVDLALVPGFPADL